METKYIIGTSGWSYPDWKDLFYPHDLPQAQWLNFYARHFEVVEINATFYRFFPVTNYEKWYHAVPASFKFIIKVPRLVTHIRYLKNSEEIIKSFCQRTAVLKQKLGLLLLQLSPRMPYDLDALRQAVLAFDDPHKVAVEFRDPQWITRDTKALLKELGCIFVAPDAPNNPLIDWITSPIGYIRLHGHKVWYNYHYTKPELKQVAKVAKSMAQQGAEKVYILLNNDVESYSVENAVYLMNLLKPS